MARPRNAHDPSSALSRLTAPGASRGERTAALRDLARQVGPSVGRPRGLAEAVTGAAPSLTPRTLVELRAAHDGLQGRELAERLIATSARVTAAIGAAGGAVAALSEATPFTLVTAPVQMGVESLAVVATELTLALELHVALGLPVPEERLQRAAFAVRVWTTGRGVNLADVMSGPGAGQLLSRAARSQLSDRLLRRFLRSGLAFMPLLAGAAAGAAVNARSTRRFGHRLLEDLLDRR